jgi:ABC-type transporter Mla subunit MlaD
VLPGTYTVKLTLGDKVLEEPVEVKLDPAIKTPVADLQQALDMQIKLREMQSNLNLSLRFVDSLETQLKQTQTTMKTLNKEPDKEMMKALEDWIKQLDALQDKLAARNEGLGLSGRDQVSDNIGNLFFSLDANFGPTAGQRAYFDELQPAYRARMDEVNKFLRDTLPQWNEKLKNWNAPTLTTRKPFEL